MKLTVKQRIRLAIQFLRSLESTNQKKIREKMQSLGAEMFDSGVFSTCYKLNKFVIKVGDDDFRKIRPLLMKEQFKQYAPTVYWIHQKGFAMVCKFVRFNIVGDWQKRVKMKDEVKKVFNEIGIELWDLHGSNLVEDKTTGQPLIVDYGCFF